jgi:hypothetical protein
MDPKKEATFMPTQARNSRFPAKVGQLMQHIFKKRVAQAPPSLGNSP